MKQQIDPLSSVQPVDPNDLGTLLRCRTTKRYFSGEGWTEDIFGAQPFPNEQEAMRACAEHHLQDIELVVWNARRKKEMTALDRPYSIPISPLSE
ncbi:MAG TPA: hypothetical protein VEC99_03145 [Clostridia bacterium]|nr:hypothetical protein [Clostridia bacterium]